MNTLRLYRNDRYLSEFSATLLSVKKVPSPKPGKGANPPLDSVSADCSLYELILDSTAFFPEGGGQSCDRGSIDSMRVVDVQTTDDSIVHTVMCSHKALPPAAGSSVDCIVDWERRFDNMQRHCGEHILSGAAYRLFGGENRGFHMGHDCMTIDIALDANEYPDGFTHEMTRELELAANEVIWSDLPVSTLYFDNYDDASRMPLRKTLTFYEDISIVLIGDVQDPADCVACCGTHPDSTGQVGMIKLYKVEKNKGMYRIYFDAGKRSLEDYRAKHAMLTELSEKYSSSISDFPTKIDALEDRLYTLSGQLRSSKQALMEMECAKLDELLATYDKYEDRVIVYKLTHFNIDDTFNMAKRYMTETKGKQRAAKSNKETAPLPAGALLMLYSEEDTAFILVSAGDTDCGSLVKDYASFYNGKGGGNKISARAIFSGCEDAMLFADLITKHLR